MSTIDTQVLPTGTWLLDNVHSSSGSPSLDLG